MNQGPVLYQEIVNTATVVALLAAFIIAAIQFSQSKKELKHKNNLEFLKNRKELRDKLKDLMTYPKNDYKYYFARRTTESTIKLDDNQPLIPKHTAMFDDTLSHMIFSDLRDLQSEVEIWFPTLKKEYMLFLSKAANVGIFSDETKRYNSARDSFDKFDKIIEKMNTIMSDSIQ